VNFNVNTQSGFYVRNGAWQIKQKGEGKNESKTLQDNSQDRTDNGK
jgi:hypothetical protein